VVLASGLVVRQICFDPDRVAQRFEQIEPQLSDEMAEPVRRAIETHAQVKEALRQRQDDGKPGDGAVIRRVEAVVLDLLALAERWQSVEREANRTSAENLTRRLQEISDRMTATSDEVARRQYAQARDALGAQLGYLRDISRTRERVVARIHNHLAALERLHLAVLNHRGADAAKLFDEVVPMLDAIDEMGQEMDFASEAMSEVARAGG
jgi:NADH dehydrogenase/NADH:ubiquinone oxidoreductase subunit G